MCGHVHTLLYRKGANITLKLVRRQKLQLSRTSNDEAAVEFGKGAGDDAFGVTGSHRHAHDVFSVFVTPNATRGVF